MPIVIDDIAFVLYVVWGFVGFAILAVLAYWLIPIERRSRALSMVTKKAYGVVEILGKGRNITKHLADFFEDYATVRKGVFFLNPDFIYKKDGANVIHFDEKDAFEPLDFTNRGKIRQILENKDMPDSIRAVLEDAGIRQIRQIIKDMPAINKIYLMPVDFRKPKPEEKVRDPQMISAVFMKQKAIAEGGALIELVNMLKIMLVIAIGAALIAAAISYMNYDILTGGNMMKDLAGGFK